MVLLIHSKPSKRFPYIEVLTKAHETVQYLPCPSLIFLTSLYYLGPRHTIYPFCDSNTEAGSYMFTVASAWKALPLYRCRGRTLISLHSATSFTHSYQPDISSSAAPAENLTPADSPSA